MGKRNKHTKKRAFIEIAGLVVLIALCYSQKGIITDAVNHVSKSDMTFLLYGVGVYVLMLPLTSFSLKLLLPKQVPIWSNTLAQLAGSGPGRIVPGGLGRLGISTLHLIKLGISTERAIIAGVSNNLIGVFVNTAILFAIIFSNDSIRQKLPTSISTTGILGFLVAIVVIVMTVRLLSGVKKIRTRISKVNKQWKSQINLLVSRPLRTVGLVLVAALILFGNITILLLCAHSLGINLSISYALIALSAGVLVGSVFPTPGGVGGVEAGTAGVLIMLGLGSADATSAALLFRLITYWLPLIPGTLAYFYLRKRKLL